MELLASSTQLRYWQQSAFVMVIYVVFWVSLFSSFYTLLHDSGITLNGYKDCYLAPVVDDIVAESKKSSNRRELN